MKNLTTKISLAALGILLIVMMFSVITSKAAEGDEPASDGEGICDLDSGNIYADKSKGLEQVIEEYHDTMNEAFNEYTLKMLEGQEEASKSNTPDPNSKAPENGDCTGLTDNYSTYCVAKTLLSNETSGYMEYLKALDCRKTSFFDTGTEKDYYNEYQEFMIIGKDNEKKTDTIYQAQKALEISGRQDAIEREIDSAKQTLDVTLATYDELKTAWAMHIRYVEIYESLVKYRDKMVEIRDQVEDFPSKFIDATTTMCT